MLFVDPTNFVWNTYFLFQTTIVMTEHENDSCRTGQGAQSDGKAIQKASLLPEQKPPNFYPEFIYA